jgi:redox-sensitive bicupin YhaK (pirin superfamily)
VAGCLPGAGKSAVQKVMIADQAHQLLASPDGSQDSLQLRQQVWLHHIELEKGEELTFQLHGRAYLQSIHGTVHAVTPCEERSAHLW